MARTTGGSAQDRRRRRRAADRLAQRQARTNAPLTVEDVSDIRALVAAVDGGNTDFTELHELLAEGLGGKPSRGTKADKRLKKNQDGDAQQPEDLALAALDAYRESVTEPEDLPDARALATAYVEVRPDLRGFEAEVEAVVRRAVRDALRAAAGDVAWGPEEGFVDLLCDVNDTLGWGDYGDSEYSSTDDTSFGFESRPRAVDAAVTLDKVLICVDGDYLVAPITIDATGEPVLSDPSDWIPVDNGWIEKQNGDAMTAATKLRFALRDVVVADGAVAPALPVEHAPGERLPDPHDAPAAPPETVAAQDGQIPWTATFVPEGVLTEDGRAFAPGALILPPAEGSRDLPLSLMGMIETADGHDGAKVAGRIDQMWREGNLVKASGVFSEEEYGQMIARMVANGELRGLSVDVAPIEWERTPSSDWFDEAGNWIAQQDESGEWVPVGEPPTLDEAIGRLFDGGEDLIFVITKAVIGAATVCPFPAFGKANIALAASGTAALYRYTGQGGFIVTAPPVPLVAAAGVAVEERDEVETITAAAAGHAPLKPPVDWFSDPELDELTPLTVTEDGRVFGHAWAWESCHLSFDGCVVAPRSETNYAYFQLGEVDCEAGERVAVGKITIDTSHAGQRLSRADATRHYDHTGTVVGHVAFGEDEHGGWFSGAISPDLSEEKLRLLRGSTLSGDWRGVDGNLELIALLAVNVPGFPVPRRRALVAAGTDETPEVVTLTAAGILGEDVLSDAEVAEIRGLVDESALPEVA